MTLRQTGTRNQWTEPKAAGVAAAMEEMQFIEPTPGSIVPEDVSAGSDRVVQLVDFHGDRTRYIALRTNAPYVIVSIGGRLTPAPSGTPAAILVDDDAGGLRATTDLTQTPAGAFYLGPAGKVIAARFDAPKAGLVRFAGTVRPFPTS